MQKIRPDLDIGVNIRNLRLSRKLKQDDVVAQLQLMGLSTSRSSYAKFESNLMNIKVSELLALKIIFDCSFEDFFANIQS
ncbi:helix-turn-helix domain-containing protein [Eisenbergiella sp.]